MKFRHKVLLAGAAGGALLYLDEKRKQSRERNLCGAVAAITGGSRGLGLAVARELAAEGCRLALCARDEDELKSARADLERRGAKVFTSVCDVSDRQQVEAFERAVSAHFGRVDIWINNASIIQVAPLENLTIEEFEKTMAINFWGVVYGAMAVLPQMRERRSGHIVNIVSIGGLIAVPHLASYSCAKFASQGFSQNLMMELAGSGVQVTTVLPGPMRTGSYTSAEFAGDAEREFGWFGGLASLPLPAPIGPLKAENAAALIVRAIKRGTRQLIIPPLPFDPIARLHGLLPEISLAVRTWINARLPAPNANTTPVKGKELLPQMHDSALRTTMEADTQQKSYGSTLNQPD